MSSVLIAMPATIGGTSHSVVKLSHNDKHTFFFKHLEVLSFISTISKTHSHLRNMFIFINLDLFCTSIAIPCFAQFVYQCYTPLQLLLSWFQLQPDCRHVIDILYISTSVCGTNGSAMTITCIIIIIII